MTYGIGLVEMTPNRTAAIAFMHLACIVRSPETLSTCP
jgi:hypothetical protein